MYGKIKKAIVGALSLALALGTGIPAGIKADVTTNPPSISEEAVYCFVNASSGKCLDVPDGKNENSVKLQTWNRNNTKAQSFKFVESLDKGYYFIIPMCAPTRAIDNPNSSKDSGTTYQLWTQSHVSAQQFKIEYVRDGYYRIINKASNMALQDEGSVNQRPISNDNAQLWKIDKMSDSNTIMNPVCQDGADPWVIKAGDKYYRCYSGGGGIHITESNDLDKLGSAKATKVFSDNYDSGGLHLDSYWAPELMYLRGRWYIYFAPSRNNGGNDAHRMYVLEGGTNKNDPLDGAYTLKGQLKSNDSDKWAIDGTVFEYNNQLYFVWSGWEGDTNVSQYLYIATMSNPYTINSNRVCISKPTYDWETNSSPTVNEGPEVIMKNGTVHIIYSASGSWMDTYCLARLTCTNGNFMDANSWTKASSPVFAQTENVHGVGHASFVKSADDTEDWIVYHAAKKAGAGWDRDVHIQYFTWAQDGTTPYFGRPVDNGVELGKPSKDGMKKVEKGAYYYIKNVGTGRMMDIPNGDDANSLKIQTWTANNSNAQQFKFKETINGLYAIVPKAAQGRAVDNPSGSQNTGVTYQTWELNDNVAQNFRLEELADGTFRLINQRSLFALEDSGEAGGNLVKQEALSNSNNQKWQLIKVDKDVVPDAVKVDGTGNMLYSNDFGDSQGLSYYKGSTPADLIRENNAITIDGGNANKIVVNNQNFSDFVVEVDAKVSENSSQGSNQAGIIFRASNFSSGSSDGYDGYYFGIDAKKQECILGKVKNNAWTEISKKKMTVKFDKFYHLQVTVAGNEITGYVNYNGTNYAKVTAKDNDFSSGTVGMRHWWSKATFKNLKVSEFSQPTHAQTYTNSLVDGQADPDVMLYKGVYYMYATNDTGANTGIKVFTSTDLVNWQDKGWALHKDNVYGTSGFWAPDLIEKDGKFYMYYVANEHISVATSNSPMGPFTQTESQKVPMHEGKEIDAHVFKDDDGQYYIYFVRFQDAAGNGGNNIWGAKLNPDMRTIDESTLTCLISPTEAWETNQAKVCEGPFMLKKDGVYYLTYSGSHFQSSQYGSGYATSNSPLGKYSKYRNNPIMQSNSLVHGAGHHGIVESADGKEMYIVYHCHKNLSTATPRRFCIDRIHFTKDEDNNTVLEVFGPTITPQLAPSGAGGHINTIDGGIEINGYQISTTVEGMRTVYSVDSQYEGQNITSSGLLYSLSDKAGENDLVIGSKNSFVRNYDSTAKGKLQSAVSTSDIATSYAMTMKFGPKTALEWNASWRLRAYARLASGKVIYSKPISYKIYDVADNLYKNKKMNNKQSHDYLFDNILSKVTNNYPRIEW